MSVWVELNHNRVNLHSVAISERKAVRVEGSFEAESDADISVCVQLLMDQPQQSIYLKAFADNESSVAYANSYPQ